jgi:putative endonuclease
MLQFRKIIHIDEEGISNIQRSELTGMSENNWVVYLVRCSDKSLYCGISSDIHRRLKEHNTGQGAKYTRSRRPVALIDISPELPKGEALKLEYRIKQMSADQKISELIKVQREILIKRGLQSLRRDIKAIIKIIDKLIKGI